MVKSHITTEPLLCKRTIWKKTWFDNQWNTEQKQNTRQKSDIVHRRELSDNTGIANAFNLYFANVGKKLSDTLEKHNVLNIDHKEYLKTPKTTSCKFKLINEHVTLTAIDKLENKTSYGHDGISNKLLKCIKHKLILLIDIYWIMIFFWFWFRLWFKEMSVYAMCAVG